MPRRVNNVNAMLRQSAIHPFPKAGGRRRSNRNAALLLLSHPVHHRRAFMHFAQFVGDAGVEQNALGRRRLARVNVGDDADVAVARNEGLGGHGNLKSEVGKGLVGGGHAMNILALFYGDPAPFGGFRQFAGEPAGGGFFRAFAHCIAQPAHRQCDSPAPTELPPALDNSLPRRVGF